LTRDVLQNNPPCQDVELNSAVRNSSRTSYPKNKSNKNISNKNKDTQGD
jgi:hypothetical protein